MITFYIPAEAKRRRRLSAFGRWLRMMPTFLFRQWSWPRDLAAGPCAPDWNLATALLMARAAAENGEWSLAESELLKGGEIALNDAVCLNMLGLAAEHRGDWPRAKRMYGRAMRRDRSYLPAEMNMRRYCELFTLGRTTVPKCLGMFRAPPSVGRNGSNASSQQSTQT